MAQVTKSPNIPVVTVKTSNLFSSRTQTKTARTGGSMADDDVQMLKMYTKPVGERTGLSSTVGASKTPPVNKSQAILSKEVVKKVFIDSAEEKMVRFYSFYSY